MNKRYFVRRESTILGAMFVVIDGHWGRQVGEAKYFERDAEELAAKLNFRETYGDADEQ